MSETFGNHYLLEEKAQTNLVGDTLGGFNISLMVLEIDQFIIRLGAPKL